MPTSADTSQDTSESAEPNTRAVATSERLALYELTEGDAGLMLAVLTDPDFVHFVGDRGVHTLEQARQSLREGAIASYREHGYGMYRCARRSDGESIGLCGLVKRDFLEHTDLGYALLPAWRGQGYAAEAAAMTRDLAFERFHLPQLWAIVSPNHAASIKVLESVGMRYRETLTLEDDDTVSLFALPREDAGSLRQNPAPPR